MEWRRLEPPIGAISGIYERVMRTEEIRYISLKAATLIHESDLVAFG